MAIRFELGQGDDGVVAFGYSPLYEAVLSLHVLAEPKHHALQHRWVRAMRTLPASLRREIAALAFLYRWTLPDSVLPTATSEYDDFEVELERLRRIRVDVVAFDLLRPIYDHGGVVRPARRRILSSPDVRARALRSAATLGPASRRAAALIFDDPHKLVERFTSLLEAYWQHAFAAECGANRATARRKRRARGAPDCERRHGRVPAHARAAAARRPRRTELRTRHSA